MNAELVINHVPKGIDEPATATHDVQQMSDTHNEMSVPPQSTQGNMFLRGYSDCAQEALWYLTEVEKLPPNHPTVVGLKMHLYEQYRMYQIQQVLRNVWSLCDDDEEGEDSMKAFNDADNDRESYDVMSEDDTVVESVTKCAIYNETPVPKYQNKNIEHEFVQIQDTEREQTNNSNNISVDVKESSTKTEHLDGRREIEEDSGLSPEAYQVAQALAEEIYSLLQSQDEREEELNEETDYYSDTDDESIDEGFDEMIEH